MYKLSRTERGFTLIELVMVIVVIGILAIVAIPRYGQLQQKARYGADEGVIGAVRGGIAVAHAESLIAGNDTWPASLDCTGVTSTVFEFVLDQGITGWTHTEGTQVYTGSSDSVWTYSALTGQLE